MSDKLNYNGQEPTTLFQYQQLLQSTIALLEKDDDKYRQNALDVSKGFLKFYRTQILYSNWENGMEIKDFANGRLGYLPFSAVAFHVLLKYDKQDTIPFLYEWIEDKVDLQPKSVQVIFHQLGDEALPLYKLALRNDAVSIDYLSAVINLLAQSFKPASYLDDLWKLIGVKSKDLKSIVVNTLVEKDVNAALKAIELLNHKKADIRQTAAIILASFPSAKASEAILQMLNREINDNVRDALLQAVAKSLPEMSSKAFINQMIAAATDRGKLSKPVEAWLLEQELPALFYTDGSQLTVEETRFLLYRMSRVKAMQSDVEAKYIIQLLDKEKAAPFAKALIKLFIEKGAKPEHKYLLAIAALLGNDEVVDFIRRTINNWIDENRYKMAEYGVGALAIQGSNKALRWVEWYSRKYKAKKANVGAAALVALETAATELDITIHELGDRIVPDFGFDGLFKEFTIEADTYRAFIDSNFKIAFFNEDNKKLKALPAVASKELKEEFKDIAKEVRDIVKSQSSRLEYYLVIQRRWTLEQWQAFFLQNPVMFIYATKILWGVYDADGNIFQTFICNEDTSLLDVNSDEMELADDAHIGIVHPSQLDEASLAACRKQFFDLKIDPIFPQLDRKLGSLADIDFSKAIITKFDGVKTENESIRNTLDRRGWHKGNTGDGGMLESYNLLYFEKRMEAILEIEGVGAGYGWGGEEQLGRLYVIDKSKLANKWFSRPQTDDDAQLIRLKDIPTIFLNEVLAAVEAIKRKAKTG